MPQGPYVIDEMISAKAIAARIEALCREIVAEYGNTDKLVVVGLLRGSFVFIADLVRELSLPIEVDFLEASSYGDSMESSREVRILKDLRGPIEGLDVLVVEDIVDTGHTLNHVTRLLRSRKPARLRSIALLDKPSRREVEVEPDFADAAEAFLGTPREQEAAVVIQSAHRRAEARKKARELRRLNEDPEYRATMEAAELERAAIAAQAARRGSVARRSVAEMRMQLEAEARGAGAEEDDVEGEV